LLTGLFLNNTSFAQKKWNLMECVEYAWAHNLTVKTADVQELYSEATLKQAKLSRIPNANFSTSTGYNLGRTINYATNTYIDANNLSQNFGLNLDVTLFNWNRIKNNIIAQDLANKASVADVDKAKNDVALNVATAYLQALLAIEQVRIVRVQVQQDSAQLYTVRKRVDAGAVPELDALQLESQLALDSSNLISAKSTAELNIIQLKSLMNFDFAAPFDIDVPPVETIPVEPIASLQPEDVYNLALTNQPAQKANKIRFESLQSASKSTKANLFPTISAFGNLGTRFSNSSNMITGTNLNGYFVNGDYVKIDPNDPSSAQPVYSPEYSVLQKKRTFSEYWDGWGNQFTNNFGQSIGINISVPIFSGYTARTNYERSKIDIKNQQIVIEQADQKLKQDIYTAYTNAVAALQKFNSSKVSVDVSQKTYDFARKRHDIGLLNTYDLITSQNNLARAKLDLANAQYDYVFKMKVLEFYKGMGLRLQ
jgi:outer membrane protein